MDSINDDNFEFNSKDRLINAFKEVSVDDVWLQFEQIFFAN